MMSFAKALAVVVAAVLWSVQVKAIVLDVDDPRWYTPSHHLKQE